MTVTVARVRLLALGALVVVAGPVLGASAPAQGHNYLVSSSPEADSTLTQLPDEFSVTTNEPLLVLGEGSGGFALQVQDASGVWFGDGCVEVQGSTVSTAAQLGASGEYTVTWQVVSGDGHTVSDRFSFTWAPEVEPEAAAGATTAPVCGAGEPGGSAGEPGGSAGESDGSAGESDGSAGDTPTTTPQPVPTSAGTNASDLVWIAGAVLVVLLAVGAAIFALGRRPKGNERRA